MKLITKYHNPLCTQIYCNTINEVVVVVVVIVVVVVVVVLVVVAVVVEVHTFLQVLLFIRTNFFK